MDPKLEFRSFLFVDFPLFLLQLNKISFSLKKGLRENNFCICYFNMTNKVESEGKMLKMNILYKSLIEKIS